MVIQGARGLLLTLVCIPAVRNLISVTFPLKNTNLTLGGTCLSSGSLASSSSICCTSEEVSGEKVADMIIAGSRYKHSEARQLRVVARDKIRQRREITEDLAFREKLREDHNCVIDFLEFVI